MEIRKRWHLFLILGVLVLTIYNILPTVFYYAQPLGHKVDKPQAEQIASRAMSRVNALEQDAIDWLHSFGNLLNTKIESIALDTANPQFITVTCGSENDAARFAAHLPRAGALIPFVPAQLALGESAANAGKTVRVKRMIPLRFNEKNTDAYFSFTQLKDEKGAYTKEYKALIADRAKELIRVVSGKTENAELVEQGLQQGPLGTEALLTIAEKLGTYELLLQDSTSIAKRFFASFTQGIEKSQINALIAKMEQLKDATRVEKTRVIAENENPEGVLSGEEAEEKIATLSRRESRLTSALQLIKEKKSLFEKGATPLLAQAQTSGAAKLVDGTSFSTAAYNPIVNSITLDTKTGTLKLALHKDVATLLQKYENTQGSKNKASLLNQLIYNDVARIGRDAGEDVKPTTEGFSIALNTLSDTSSLLVLDLKAIAEQKEEQLLHILNNEWKPTSKELSPSAFPRVSYEDYKKLAPAKQRFAFVVSAPVLGTELVPHMRSSSLYIVAKGLNPILKKVESAPNAVSSKRIMSDLQNLRSILEANGLIGYPASTLSSSQSVINDFVFEEQEYYQELLAATRENFTVHGTKKFATLDLSTNEQRLLTLNRIETAMHEDLLKWKDEYQAAQVKPDPLAKFEVPKPTKSTLLNNFVLSAKKYFRGDERKILKWGLDLSGGKTVQIELRDQNNRLVTGDNELKQGINELTRRVNKMGVSEVAIRQEGANITLEFPGSQNLSASDLVKASSMYFHVVNEKFSMQNKELSEHIRLFLQDVWNEAVVTNRKDAENVNRIAYSLLYGDADAAVAAPRTNAAKALYEAGLRLANPDANVITSEFDTSLSRIAMLRGDSFKEWMGQANPLLVVFNNFVLEGSSLSNIKAGYDATKGNFLSFSVKNAHTLGSGMSISPRADLFNWTSHFSKESIADSPLRDTTGGRGYRMAVILNDTVISSPTLDVPLDNTAMISGSFTQREINKLEADLKAGSLSYTPVILSEQNISPELGMNDRVMGVAATGLALFFVVALMVGYYRFAGVVASIAVLFNLLLIWAALQNIQATLTLAGIAGIILTVGMAVDANVLVFERIREEFERTGKIATAVRAGYSKAFTAILDSNITTIIAALILLNFDSGPIKGLALTLIIGIASSMFTALFMTRYYFAGWIKNPKNTSLSMAQWFKKPNFPFLKYAKVFGVATALVALSGTYIGYRDSSTFLGMDFTGGFAMNIEVKKSGEERARIESALEKAGVTPQEMQVRELAGGDSFKILLSSSLDSQGKPFYGMPLEVVENEGTYRSETNPRISWVISQLEKEGVELTERSKTALHTSWTSISGQMSETMRNQALIGLSIALACILLYIAIRFEFTYAVAATLGLVVDVLFTMGLLALLHMAGVQVQIDLKTIAAIMTIIGYSLNDTIIIFDRIREDVRLSRNKSLAEVMHTALNVTLSRTVMTSTTTLVVLLALIALGGSTIFGLTLVMIIGVTFGTLSSLFVAAPLLLFFNGYEEKKKVLIQS